jgi:hypothetical protein
MSIMATNVPSNVARMVKVALITGGGASALPNVQEDSLTTLQLVAWALLSLMLSRHAKAGTFTCST